MYLCATGTNFLGALLSGYLGIYLFGIFTWQATYVMDE